MKLFRLSLSSFLFSLYGLIGQTDNPLINSQSTVSPNQSKIKLVSGADSSFFKIEMLGARYDFSKNQLPYYQVYKSTPKNQTATASLIIKGVKVLSEFQAAVVKKYYSGFITTKFELNGIHNLSRDEYSHIYKITPLRLNSLNQVEELTDYEINWQISPNENNVALRAAGTFKSNSILASGTWYKIGVTASGVYKIDKTFFNDLGIPTANLDPRKIRIYGNGGKMVPELNSAFRYDDLEENAIYVNGENDGVFDNADYVLFYASGTDDWEATNLKKGLKFKATSNLYSDTSFYYINTDLGNGKRMSSRPSVAGSANVTSNSYDYYNFHELNVVNFGKTGREMYGEYFDITNTYNFKWNEGDFVVSDTLISEVSVVSQFADSVKFAVNFGTSYYNLGTRGLRQSTHEDYAAPGYGFGYALCNNASELSINITKTTPKSVGWLNKVTVNARRRLSLKGKQFNFRDTRVVGAGKVCKYTIDYSGNTNLFILNITNPVSPVIQNFDAGSTSLEFTASSENLNEYCLVPQTDFYKPAYVGKVPNQNLHAILQADYVVVSHPLFMKEAEKIAAFHKQVDGLTNVVVPVDKIYNEFGSGKPDAGAIRDFVRMLYSRNIASGKQVKYLLLIGDGSFNNKNRNLVNNSALIPTYQSFETLSETLSTASDDFYAMMDDTEGLNVDNSGGVDIGVGRFTCRTNAEVNAIINKIVNYYKKDNGFSITESSETTSQSVMGDWRNWLVFLGDDEDGALHMKDADRLTKIVETKAPFCNIDKIFLDSYQRYSTAGGMRYPDAATDFLKRIRKGALVFNYTGHGGEVGLTAERMIDVDIINKLDNYNKLPLFVTATCEFSRYDDPARTSAGELCLLNAKGGAVGLFTTCRIAYSNSNYDLNSTLLDVLFTKLPDGKFPCLGEILQKTKAKEGQPQLANFHLLGDPAMRLAYPEEKVYTSAINGKGVSSNSSDTLAALSKVTISGFVADNAGNKLSGFNGLVYPTVFDKVQSIKCLLNSQESAINLNNPNDSALFPFVFNLQRNILYRGKIQVTNGDFTFSFLVPKDVSFSPGPGKISYYATNGLTDASGFYNNLVVGGASKNAVTDNEGPKIELFLNDKSYVSGSVTNEDPILFANLSDSSGINTIGTGIGHDISVILDQNTSKPINLNDYFEANLNSYQSGKLRYPFSELSEGNHRLTFRAWDIQNNSTTVNSDFIVAKTAEMALDRVLNYPNPFTTNTKFMFQHNQGCNPIKVVVQVYSISGKIVKTLQKSVSCSENGSQWVDWDGKDDYGDKLGKGVYIYKLAILDSENKKAEKIEKLVILN